jgi:hypothetical protein
MVKMVDRDELEQIIADYELEQTIDEVGDDDDDDDRLEHYEYFIFEIYHD